MCVNAPNRWMNAVNECSPAGCSSVNHICETVHTRGSTDFSRGGSSVRVEIGVLIRTAAATSLHCFVLVRTSVAILFGSFVVVRISAAILFRSFVVVRMNAAVCLVRSY